MRRSRSSALALLLALGAGGNVQAQSDPSFEGGGALFLLFPVGARATATGQAATSDGGSTEALYWNPAGLQSIQRSEAALHYYNRGIFGTGTALVVALPSGGLGTFAFGAYLVDFGEDEVRPGPGQPTGKILTRNVSLNAAFATEVAFGINAGIAYKLVQFRVDCSGDCSSFPTAVGTTHAVDIGLRYAFTTVPIELGAALRHLGFNLQVNNQAQADPLPTRLAIGMSGRIVRPDSGAEGVDVRIMGDVVMPVTQSSSNPYAVFGIDGGVRDVVRIRAGYAFLAGQAGGPSIGLGVHVGRVSIDLGRTFDSGEDLGEQEPMHLSVRVAL